MSRFHVAALAVAPAIAAVLVADACMHPEVWAGPSGPPPPAEPELAPDHEPASAPKPSDDSAAPGEASGTHPRILLTPDRLATLRRLRAENAPTWRKLSAQCDADTQTTIDAGYQAWDWANATLALALCYHVTHRPSYAGAAVKYFRALLDDYIHVGDGAGGDAAVHHDSGYAIRTHGGLGAVACDWLHDVPGMTTDLRKHAADRFLAWTHWFSAEGYNRDEPIANYYAGYFATVAFGGLAMQGDDPRAGALLAQARRMYSTEIGPAFRTKLAGGDFPEGWQYGDMVGAVLAIFAGSASQERTGRPLLDELPWLRDTVRFRAHALWPDGKHMFDMGDWSSKPAVAPTHTLLALAAVLSPADDASRQALALARLAADPNEEWTWLAALAEDPSRRGEDPRRGPASYLAPGTGIVTARTDWTPGAVWLGFACGPSLSDHQHLDDGHFEVVRGGDALVIDAGGYASYSSLSHNVIAVDDRKDNDNYSPNQGVWSLAHVTRFEDRGSIVYALGDYASAYNPSGYPQDHPSRSVIRAQREIVFSRSPVEGMGAESARVVVYDRVKLSKPSYATAFLLHGGSPPVPSSGASIRFDVGQSGLTATSLLPVGGKPAFVAEPTSLGDGPFYANDPPEGTRSVRLEIRSPLGSDERRFLNILVVGERRSQDRGPTPVRVYGAGVDGAAVGGEAFVFPRDAAQVAPAPLAWSAPASVRRYVAASLAPGSRFTVSAERDRDACRFEVSPADKGIAASDAGLLVFDVEPGCGVR